MRARLSQYQLHGEPSITRTGLSGRWQRILGITLMSVVMALAGACVKLPETDRPKESQGTASVKGVKVTFSVVERTPGTTLPPSIPPGQTRPVTATIGGTLPSGHSIKIVVVNGGTENGTASIDGTDTIAATGTISVKGGNQTAPKHDGQLKLRALLDGDANVAVGESNGFSVCAHPTDYTDSFIVDINGATVGLNVQDGWSSDGGGPITELGETLISELVAESQRNNPPFTVNGQGNNSHYLAGDKLTKDGHAYSRANIAAGPTGTMKIDQLCMFKCNRCGAVDINLPNSGFQIVHTVFQAAGGQWKHHAEKIGAAVTIGAHTTTAGAIISGPCISQDHNIP